MEARDEYFLAFVHGKNYYPCLMTPSEGHPSALTTGAGAFLRGAGSSTGHDSSHEWCPRGPPCGGQGTLTRKDAIVNYVQGASSCFFTASRSQTLGP